jgi:hypothetical protein
MADVPGRDVPENECSGVFRTPALLQSMKALPLLLEFIMRTRRREMPHVTRTILECNRVH